MSTSFTPGPWRYNPGTVHYSPLVQRGLEGGFLVMGSTVEQANADARLIAAAPEMLKALQRLTHPSADDDDLAYALEVIAKATGGAV